MIWLHRCAADPAKKENERLCQEFEDQITEYKRVKSCLEQLAADYQRAKQLFVTTRYRELKGLHCPLLPTPPHSCPLLPTPQFLSPASSRVNVGFSAV